MIEDFADLCTHVYVIVDELYQLVIAPHDHRLGYRSEFRDGEVITLTLVAEPIGLDEERQPPATLPPSVPTVAPGAPGARACAVPRDVSSPKVPGRTVDSDTRRRVA